jgi:exodeoxyribonuclease V alpha subunit
VNNEEKQASRLDKAFASFLSARTALPGPEKSRFATIIRELSYAQNHGHICIHLNQEEQTIIRSSGVLAENHSAPLVLEQERLYLHRYWHYETRLARQILQMCKNNFSGGISTDALDRYFKPVPGDADWQRQAAIAALTQTLCIITGGPGTGKTTTVVKILALMIENAKQPLQIALAAPTGKAAMHLQESIGNSKNMLPCPEAVKEQIPDAVSTLHRLLGAKPPSPFFLHNAGTPLPYDLVVIDEASMVDLALMSKFVDAMKTNARLILLGDKDQLASVESGAVLADLTSALPDHTRELKKSFRFEDDIKNLALAVNRQQAGMAWQLLKGGTDNVALLSDKLIPYIVEKQTGYLQQIAAGNSFAQINQAFSEFQVLCATRYGKNSVSEINSKVEQQLAGQLLINPSGQWYSGRPVMVTQNDANMHLYNGDLGICLADKEQGGKLMVFFERPDKSIQKILPARLPHCETVFAMTIHKSQGSEFVEVLIVLPEMMNPVLTKELLYTAITRAKQTVKIVADPSIFKAAIKQKVERYAGLAGKLLHETK